MDWRHHCRIAGAIVGGIVFGLPCLSLSGRAPEVVELVSLSEFYDGVEFDHALHEDVAEGCSTCHHHTTGGAAEGEPCATCHDGTRGASSVACRDCHPRQPFTPDRIIQAETGDQWFHVDKPGLKGAYHQNCLGCHRETGAPSGCQDCHDRTPAGDELFDAAARGLGDRTGRGEPR